MKKSNPKASQAIQCRVELVGTHPLVWRSIHILANSSLTRLIDTIRNMMFWAGYEPSHVVVADERYGDPAMDFEFEAWLDASTMTVGRAFNKNHELEYIYGSEHEWRLRVIFEDIFPPDPGQRYPVCVSGENAEPPFGCAGPAEFKKYKKTVNIVKYPIPRSRLSSLQFLEDASRFDPSFFDLRVLNDTRFMRKKPPSKTSRG